MRDLWLAIKRALSEVRAFRDYSWRRVPPPNWRSCRGGREYW